VEYIRVARLFAPGAYFLSIIVAYRLVLFIAYIVMFPLISSSNHRVSYRSNAFTIWTGPLGIQRSQGPVAKILAFKKYDILFQSNFCLIFITDSAVEFRDVQKHIQNILIFNKSICVFINLFRSILFKMLKITIVD